MIKGERLGPPEILITNPLRVHYIDETIDPQSLTSEISSGKRGLVRAQEVFADVDGEVVVFVSPISYEEFLAGESEGLNAPSPFSIGALTFTSDGYLVLGERSQAVGTEAGKIHLVPAGYLEWSHVKNWRRAGVREPHERALKSELYEELGVRRYLEAKPLGIVNRFLLDNPMLIFLLNLSYTKDSLLAAWEKRSRQNSEHAGLIFVKKGKLEGFQDDWQQNFTDHLRGALFIHTYQTKDLLPSDPVLFGYHRGTSLQFEVNFPGETPMTYFGLKNIIWPPPLNPDFSFY